MELRDTPEQASFRAEVRTWLEANAPSPGTLASLDTAEGFEAHRRWERRMFDDRWSVVSWPEKYGGRDVGIFEWLIFEEEYYRAQAPLRVSQNGIFLLAPTLMHFGTDEQRDRYLSKMASAEEIWCQGWSEPDAGSDLASLRSRAVRAPGDDGWLLTGQKTWASRGAFAEWCFGLFRTDLAAERHRGMTYFLIPTGADGVTVRPIPQIDGETGFAELFFENVFVPDSQVLGEVGQGWNVTMATAGSERGLNLRSPARYTEAANRLVALYAARSKTWAASTTWRDNDKGILGQPPPDLLRDQVARAWMDAEAYRLATLWTATRVAGGATVGAEASANKIHWSETDLNIYETGMALLGPQAELTEVAGEANRWLDGFLFALAGPIYAGTNEIQRDTVARRILGLPRG